MARILTFVLCIATVACATATAPDQISVSGHVRLVPHADLRELGIAMNAYGDRRLRNARLVDYSRPGFSVVYLDHRDAQDSDAIAPRVDREVHLAIRGGDIRARLEPAHLAMRTGDVIRLRNLDRDAHIVSCPKASVLQQVAPGEEVRFELSMPGVYRFYLADTSAPGGIVFVAPGPFSVTSNSGRFHIPDLTPGTWTLHAWHPRFPPASREVVLATGDSLEIDFEIGVGHAQESN